MLSPLAASFYEGCIRARNDKLKAVLGVKLRYPSYRDGLRALHGWTDVPTYAASHGCVRIPYWNAIWVYGLADIGTRVAVYH